MFLEKEFISKGVSGSRVDLEEIQYATDMETDIGTDSLQEVDVLENEGETDIQPPPVRRSDRERHAPEIYGLNISKGDDACNGSDEPISYQEAMEGPEAAKWQEAMDSEIQSMLDNQVWTLIDHTPGVKLVGCKWVCTCHTPTDGGIRRGVTIVHRT